MSARAYRVYVPSVVASIIMAVQEIEFRATVGGAAQNGGTPFGSPFYTDGSFPAGFPPPNAFDGVITGLSFYASSIPNGLPAFIGMDYGVGASINVPEFGVRARADDPGGLGQAPSTFWLEGTNDDPANQFARWYAASPVFTETSWTLGQLRLYNTLDPVDHLAVAKMSAQVSTGAWETAMSVSKLSAGVLSGGLPNSISVSKLSADVLSGAQPNRISVSKLSAEVFSGAQPDRLSVSKMSAEMLLQLILRARNGPVQIIGG